MVAISSLMVQLAVVVAPATATLIGGSLCVNAYLYVGDLEESVNEGQFFDLFSQVAHVVSVRACRDQTR